MTAVHVQLAGAVSEYENERDVFFERMFESLRGTFDLYGIYLGIRLGFYRALDHYGALSPIELAVLTGTAERYAREWLEQQTVTDVVRVMDAQASPHQRRYWLPEGRAEVLVDEDSLSHLAPLVRMAAGALSPLESVVAAYRSGAGVEADGYGPDLAAGQAGLHRAAFLQQLGSEWLPALPDVHERLQSPRPAQVVDIGCGVGWSSIGIARQYPHVRVRGFDRDTVAVERARRNARDYGVADRVSFSVWDVRDPAPSGEADLVCAFQCLHDLVEPIQVLKTMRRLAAPRGAVWVADGRVDETFTGAGTHAEQLAYGWSLFHCLPANRSRADALETGAVLRPHALRRLALDAGFDRLEILPIENDFFRFYRLYA